MCIKCVRVSKEIFIEYMYMSGDRLIFLNKNIYLNLYGYKKKIWGKFNLFFINTKLK